MADQFAVETFRKLYEPTFYSEQGFVERVNDMLFMLGTMEPKQSELFEQCCAAALYTVKTEAPNFNLTLPPEFDKIRSKAPQRVSVKETRRLLKEFIKVMNQPTAVSEPDEWLTSTEVSRLTGKSIKTIDRQVKDGTFPKPIQAKRGGHKKWRRSDLNGVW